MVLSLLFLRLDTVKFQPVIDETVTEFFRHGALQCLDFCVLELDYLTALNIDQVVVMRFGNFFVARTAVAKIVPIQNIVLFEQADRTVDGRDTDFRIDRNRALVDKLDVRMVVRFTQNTRNDAALTGNLQPLIMT